MPPHTPQSYALPIAILLGFAIIAGALFVSNISTPPAMPEAKQQQGRVNNEPSTEVKEPVRPVSDTDFVRGNPDAPIMLITYTDYECFSCKNFHTTMNRIIQEYGMTGQVAWTMRHMPMADLHENAPVVANAAECAGTVGDHQTFWEYADTIFAERDFFGTTSSDDLMRYAESLDLDMNAFRSCVEENKHEAYLNGTTDEAFAAGAAGAPYTVVVSGDAQGALNGAQPYGAMREVVERMLAQLENFVEQQVPASSIETLEGNEPE